MHHVRVLLCNNTAGHHQYGNTGSVAADRVGSSRCHQLVSTRSTELSRVLIELRRGGVPISLTGPIWSEASRKVEKEGRGVLPNHLIEVPKCSGKFMEAVSYPKTRIMFLGAASELLGHAYAKKSFCWLLLMKPVKVSGGWEDIGIKLINSTDTGNRDWTAQVFDGRWLHIVIGGVPSDETPKPVPDAYSSSQPFPWGTEGSPEITDKWGFPDFCAELNPLSGLRPPGASGV
ncbi:hypothetical protein B0H16DRAFT_1456188 [Mycena metata]|uniref:Uncharacterized protein n=1 Tax=Mycena metata TaxID=1033252 RepID=A0AAD7JDG3_9AGAR|nr:hypothetical protein B0H16DRAFT_1456188 [Mycena metata]